MLSTMDGGLLLSTGVFGGLVGATLTQVVVGLRERRARADVRKSLSRDATAEFIAEVGTLLGALSTLLSALRASDLDEIYKLIDAGTEALGGVNIACAKTQLTVTDDDVNQQIEDVYEIVGATSAWLSGHDSDPTNPVDELIHRIEAFYEALDDELDALLKVAAVRLKP